MKKKIFLVVIMLCILVFSLCACIEDTPDDGDKTAAYTVTFIAGDGGEGTPPVIEDKKNGDVFALPQNTFSRNNYNFAGWVFEGTTYMPNDKFTMPAKDVCFTASWTVHIPDIGQPAFSQSEYNYDRLGGEDLELPLALNGGNLYYIDLDDETLYSTDYYYDDETKCLVIKADKVLALGNGTFSIKAITDAPNADTATCTLHIDNSVKTSFDSVTTKEFRYGYEKEVSFSIDFNGTTIKSLKQGDIVVDPSYYEQTSEGISIKSSWLKKNYLEATYSVLLSNNDQYSFTVKNNIIFYTDYDLVTIHDTTSSNAGLNSLYQYSDNVEIVDNIEGMDGKVLRFTPNTQDVLYDCHSIYTLRKSNFDATWYNVGYTEGKYYAFSFDYMTEGTSTGTFFFGSRDTSWAFDLLLGAENDGTVHHFEAIASAEQIANGTWVRAFFKDAGGCIYFDNFTVIELDSMPSVSTTNTNYTSGDLTLDCSLKDFECDFYIDDVLVNDYVTVGETSLTIGSDALKDLEPGQHTISVKTDIGTISQTINVVDSRVCEITTKSANYNANKAQSVKFYGNFDASISLVSAKQIAKTYDGGYGEVWNFAQCDTQKDYASLLTLVAGLDNQGYVEIPASVADLFFGTTQFDLTFSNGTVERITLNSSIVMSSNFDDTSILGYLNGQYSQNSPMYSGMGGNSIISIEQRSDGNNALFVRSTENAQASTIFCMKFMSHGWEWMQVKTNENNQYRVTFTYKISSNIAENSVYFYIMDKHESDVPNTFFQEGYEVVDVGGWNQIRWYLTADGNEHVFDTGWFANTTTTCDLPRLMQLQLPSFSQSEDKYVMVDDLRVWETDDAQYFLTNNKQYTLGANGITFSTPQAITTVKIDDATVAFTSNDGTYVLDKDTCNALSEGSHTLCVIGERGTYKVTFTVVDNRVATLLTTDKYVVRGQESVTLSGQFDPTLSVVSLNRKGTLSWDNTLDNTAVKSDGALPLSYISLSENGITLSKGLIDQVYGTMAYTVKLSNNKEVTFSLTSNVMYFSNWDETYVQEESWLVEGGGNIPSCQDTSMIEIVDVNGNKMYKYSPANATLGHSQAGFSGGRDNGCLTFANSNFTSEWWNFDFASVDTVIVFFDYTIVASDDKTAVYQFTYRDNQIVYHTVPLDRQGGTFYIELDANTLERFYINCAMTQQSDAEGTYMLIDNFGFGVKENNGQANNRVYRSHYNITDGMSELKVDGEFQSDVTIASITRQAPRMNAAGSLDPAYTTPASVDVSWAELSSSGITLKQELLSLIYGTTRLDFTLSNGDTFSLVLKSNVFLFVDYDNIMFFDSVSNSDANAMTEWTQDTNMLEIVDDNGNKKMVYTPANTIRGDAVSNANNGALNFSDYPRNGFWYYVHYQPVGTITISFDYEIDLGAQTESYFSTFWYSISDGGFNSARIDAEGTHYSITFNAEDLVLFRIYCPVSDASQYEGTSMSIDNFKIVLN